MVSTTLKPQNLVQNRNSKTHLTNHCFGIRCGKNLLKVVKPQGNVQIHIHIFQLTLRQENEIAKRTGELITILPGKKEENLMLHMEDNQIMYFRGEDIPCMMVAIKLYKSIDFDAKKKFTEELIKMIKETTNIEPNDIYVSFDEYQTWGKQGILF